jgi:omega-3 fatty acid desaturase (delta-15 desaturase)
MDARVVRKEDAAALQLNVLKKHIPAQCFEKNVPLALGYMVLDLSMWAGVTFAMHSLCHTETWAGLELWQRWIATAVFWNLAGFLMWAVFIIGHDCGHGTFSDSEFLNDVVGHLTHGAILVPFYPWQLSHRRHHMYHNHEEKDYSHPWYTAERLARPEEGAARVMDSLPYLRLFYPIVGWPLYLIGLPDGSHLFPHPQHRLWKDTPAAEYFKCILSTAVVGGYLALGYLVHGGSLLDMAYYYLAPWLVMGWWLVTVTYLQHHHADTLVYDDADWTFVTAAFETIDRRFGLGIDAAHHHITDGHVVHHLFFTKIPHYHLPVATEALKQYLSSINLTHLYRDDDTWDFPYRVFKQYFDIGLKAKKASEVGKKKGH